tara:strand:- start:1199 stop:1378 length:180 start_codon:yes stop_codon:yes gene_type:complete
MTEDEIKKYLKEKAKTCTHSPVYIGNSEKWSVVMCKLCGQQLNKKEDDNDNIERNPEQC